MYIYGETTLPQDPQYINQNQFTIQGQKHILFHFESTDSSAKFGKELLLTTHMNIRWKVNHGRSVLVAFGEYNW
jgi:hypothetical protein